MAMKTYKVNDEGDALEVAFFDGDLQVAGAFLPMDFGEDAAMELAKTLGDAFGKPVGDGAGSAPYMQKRNLKH